MPPVLAPIQTLCVHRYQVVGRVNWMCLGGLGQTGKHYNTSDPEIWFEFTKIICIYLFKETKLIIIKYRKILISREELEFTKLFQFIRPTTCTYQYIIMTSVHCYMFRLLTAIIRKPHQHSERSELWQIVRRYDAWCHNDIAGF